MDEVITLSDSSNSSSSESDFDFSLSNSWLTVSLIVLLLGLTIEYKRVNNINELMSEQLKDLRRDYDQVKMHNNDLRRDYDQLKMHDTNEQLQILTELRALRDCGPPATIHEPKEVELKPVEIEPKAEDLKTEIKEEPKTTVEPQPMDIQKATEVEAKPTDEPNDEQLPTDEQKPNDEKKIKNDSNDRQCNQNCVSIRKTRRSIVEFCSYVVSHPIDIFFSFCLAIWKRLTVEVILTCATRKWMKNYKKNIA
ncbi:hypothetical protein M3Y94_01075400 [Aphelenchoides besseyi]|nr:hypothetical protein M3Y94_01075400 [Aphelenchoides besseyi]